MPFFFSNFFLAYIHHHPVAHNFIHCLCSGLYLRGGGAKALPCVILAPLHLKFVAPPEPHMILLSFRAPSFFLIPQIPPPPLGKISVYSPDVYSTKTTVTIITYGY